MKNQVARRRRRSRIWQRGSSIAAFPEKCKLQLKPHPALITHWRPSSATNSARRLLEEQRSMAKGLSVERSCLPSSWNKSWCTKMADKKATD